MHAQLSLAPLGDQRECRDHEIQWAEHKNQKYDLQNQRKKRKKKKNNKKNYRKRRKVFFFLLKKNVKFI